MKDFIRAIWYGQICPSKNCALQNKEIAELEELKERNKADLLKSLNASKVESLEKYEGCEEELDLIYMEEAFMEGVRFAIKFIVEGVN